MKKVKKQIPYFKNEDEERDFWDTHSPLDYFDLETAIINPKFPNLKPSTQSISLRLPTPLLEDLKMLANQTDVPYQSLMKVFLKQRVMEEMGEYKVKSKK